MAPKRKYYRWSAKISRETLEPLQKLATVLGYLVKTPGRYQGTGSAPDMLDALADAYRRDPGGTALALKVLLQANGLLPEQSVPAADTTD